MQPWKFPRYSIKPIVHVQVNTLRVALWWRLVILDIYHQKSMENVGKGCRKVWSLASQEPKQLINVCYQSFGQYLQCGPQEFLKLWNYCWKDLTFPHPHPQLGHLHYGKNFEFQMYLRLCQIPIKQCDLGFFFFCKNCQFIFILFLLCNCSKRNDGL